MKNMEHSGFSAKDICDIIRACQKSSVKELKLGDMCVSFNLESTQPTNIDVLEQGLVQYTENDAKDGRQLAQPLEIPLNMVTSEQQDEIRKFEENLMMISDPMAYEQTIIDSYDVYSSQESPMHD